MRSYMTFCMTMMIFDLGFKRTLDERGVVDLAKLVKEALGVDPNGDAVLTDWVLG